MKLYGWNCRNLTGQGNVPLFYNFLEQSKPYFIMLNETKGFNTRKFKKACPEYSFQYSGGKVMMVCKKGYLIQIFLEDLNDEIFMVAKLITLEHDGREGDGIILICAYFPPFKNHEMDLNDHSIK